MNEILLSPPVAFLIYVALVGILFGAGRLLASDARPSVFKALPYASGEAPPTRAALPGYRTFFVVALFFVILHLGALVLASSSLTWLGGVYGIGLLLILVVLILK